MPLPWPTRSNAALGALITLCHVEGARLALPAQESEDLPLPRWTEQDAGILQKQPEALPLGGLLWPDGFDAGTILPPEPQIANSPPPGLLDENTGQGLPPTPPDRRGNYLLFIPKPGSSLIKPAPAALPAPPHALVEVGSSFLQQCEALEPEASLLDPHPLLAETQSEDLRRFLTYHAGQAQTFAHFLLLDSHEKLPLTANLSRLGAGRFAQDHACLAAYPLGEPWRARLFMTSDITANIGPAYLGGMLRACVQDALQASDPVEQLQRFATQLSIRLIWMEREHPAAFARDEPPPQHADVVESSGTLTEVTHAKVNASAIAQSSIDWKKISTRVIWSLAIVAFLGFFLAVARRWHRRRIRHSVWMLPEAHIQPRLGAPHCGHGGVWIHYG